MADLAWSDLKVLLSLSKSGSVAGAARDLAVDNSTVSRRLAALEEAIGAKLILRGGREFQFTAEGQAALKAAVAMADAAAAAQSVIRASRQEIEGTVRISVVASFSHFIYPAIEHLMGQYGKLKLELLDANQTVSLARGEADLAIRMFRPIEPDLIARRAVKVGWYAYAAPAYLSRHGHPAVHDDLLQHKLILYAMDRLHVPPMAWLEKYNSHPSPPRVSNTGAALQHALAGNGIAALPTFDLAENYNLLRVFPEPFYRQDGFVVYHESLRHSARIKAVVDGLLDFLADKTELLAGIPRR